MACEYEANGAHFVIIDVFIVSRFLLILIITRNLRLVRR